MQFRPSGEETDLHGDENWDRHQSDGRVWSLCVGWQLGWPEYGAESTVS